MLYLLRTCISVRWKAPSPHDLECTKSTDIVKSVNFVCFLYSYGATDINCDEEHLVSAVAVGLLKREESEIP